MFTQDTWRRCVSYSSSFVHNYIAYHHYRSKVGVHQNATQANKIDACLLNDTWLHCLVSLQCHLHTSAVIPDDCQLHTMPSKCQLGISFCHALLQGWIPRSGLQYGTDLVLYEKHPSLVHSTMCVIIVPMAPPTSHDDQTSAPAPHGADGALSWHDVEGINRLCIRVHLIFVCPCITAHPLLQCILPSCAQYVFWVYFVRSEDKATMTNACMLKK